MRLRFFDRFRRLVRRRPATNTASEPHGRHRRAHRQSSAPPPESRSQGQAGISRAARATRIARAIDAARRLAGRGNITGAAYPRGSRRVGEGADPRGTAGRGGLRRGSQACAGRPQPPYAVARGGPRVGACGRARPGRRPRRRARAGRHRDSAPAGRRRPVVAPRGRSGAADQAAVRGPARQGAAADRGRPAELRLDASASSGGSGIRRRRLRPR